MKMIILPCMFRMYRKISFKVRGINSSQTLQMNKYIDMEQLISQAVQTKAYMNSCSPIPALLKKSSFEK